MREAARPFRAVLRKLTRTPSPYSVRGQDFAHTATNATKFVNPIFNYNAALFLYLLAILVLCFYFAFGRPPSD